MRTADYIIQRLYKECSRHLFTVTGRGILYLTDAAAKHSQMKCISVHHEQAGAFAAAAYGCYTGKPGVCLVSTGCASTNTVTALLCAYQDGAPCVFISGNNPLNETVNYTKLPVRTFGSQETDIIPIVSPVTKYAVMLTDKNKIAYELDKALYYANEGFKGPVWIDMPIDIQSAPIEPGGLERFTPQNTAPPRPAAEDMQYLQTLLNESERPCVLIGSGIRSSGAVREIAEFVEKFNIPLIYAHTAPDTYCLSNKLSIGAAGSITGTRAGNFTVQNADLLLVVGCRLTSVTVGSKRDKFARAAKVIVIDISKDEHTKNTVDIDRLVISDAKAFLQDACKLTITADYTDWVDRCLKWKKIFPKCEDIHKQPERVDLYYLAECLSDIMPNNSALVCDAGLEQLILPSNVNFRNGMRCIQPAMQGAMGFALPGAAGAYLAGADTVCAVIGDGSVMMNLQELETIRYNNLPIKIIVINNNMYAVIRKRQADLFRTRTIGTDPANGVSCPSFKKVAECFNIPYAYIGTTAELKNGLKEVLCADGPVLCEIAALPDQEYLRDAYALNSKKRLVHRPIEDLHPFLDRKVFLSEMIIEPIDQ